jgi:large-conductance mechanosensitive channel
MEDLLISLLPIIIVVFVWIFIMIRFKKHFKNNKYNENQDEMIILLKEIKEELKQLNQKNTLK